MASKESIHNNGVSLVVEHSRDIHMYNKLLNATIKFIDDEELKSRIQSLPDDMIREIKKYVMSPYKFLPELKLYKVPLFFTHNNQMWRTSEIGEHRYQRQSEGGGFFTHQTIRRLNYPNARVREYGFQWRDTSQMFKNCELLKTLHWISEDRMTSDEVKDLLKELNIKGRSKMLVYKNFNSKRERNLTIINAILKATHF